MFSLRHLAVPVAVSLGLGLAIACEPEVKIGKASAPITGRMQISKDGKTLYVALADHDLVRAVDAATGKMTGEVAVTGYPHRLTVLDDGRVAVTSRYAGTLSILNVEKGTVDSSVDVGTDPFGVVQVDDHLLVAVSGEAQLARVDLAEPTKVAKVIPLAHELPRGIAKLPDGRVVVSHFSAGYLSTVQNDEVVAQTDMRLPSKQFFFPNQMGSVTASVDGGEVIVPHVECNNDPAQFAGGVDFTGQPTVTYYVDGPTGYPAVNPALSTVDADASNLTTDEDRKLEEANGTVAERAGPSAPVIDSLNGGLLGGHHMNGPQEVAYVDGGKLQLVVARGSGNVWVRRATLREGQSSLVGIVEIGDNDAGVGLESIQISPDGETAYVYNAFDDTISSFAVPRGDTAKSQFAGSDGGGDITTTRQERLREIAVDKSFHVADAVLPKDVREGRKMFFAVNDSMTKFGAISCDSCHPGAGPDGTTWRFAEGPRQSPALWGGILGTEPFHWDQGVQNMAGISDVTIVGRMGGSGLDATHMNKIGAFLEQVPAPAAPENIDPDAAARGAQIFYSAAAGCAECHQGANFTDNLAHPVGTGGGDINNFTGEYQTEFATPVLHGLAQSAPYLHDGSAKTLEELIDRLVVTNQMGHSAGVQTEQQKADLVAFLKTL